MGIMDKIEFDPEQIPKVKLILHGIHGVLAFIIFVLEIVVFRAQDSRITGNNGWTFAMCFLTIPAVLYLAMAPRWERTRRIAQPHAMLVVDVLWAILWVSGFATQASYNARDECGQGCAVSRGVVAVAFFQILFWIASAGISAITLKHYQHNGVLPGYENLSNRPGGGENIDPDKAAFSMAPHDEEAYAPVHMDDRHDDDHHGPSPYSADAYGGAGVSGSAYGHDTSYRPQSTSPPPQENPFDNTYQMNDPYSDSYNNLYGGSQVSSSQVYAPPTADDYDPTRPAQFPSANYDRTMH
jgi:hypothetical protein